MDYLNDNILTLNQRMDKMSEERMLLTGTRDPRNRGLMKRKAAKPDDDWQVTPIPRIARKKRKVSNLLSPTQVSSAPPTPYKWDIPPTPPRGEVEDGKENKNEFLEKSNSRYLNPQIPRSLDACVHHQ